MKQLKITVGLILLGLSLLLFYEFGLHIWFLSTDVATFGELWVDLLLYLISGVLILRYGWQLISRSLPKKKRPETLDEGQIGQDD